MGRVILWAEGASVAKKNKNVSLTDNEKRIVKALAKSRHPGPHKHWQEGHDQQRPHHWGKEKRQPGTGVRG
jgi:hypothetical protein